MADADVLKAKWLKKYQRHSRKYGTFVDHNGTEYIVCISPKAFDDFMRIFTVNPWMIPDIKYVGYEFEIPFDQIKYDFAIRGSHVWIDPDEMIDRSY